VSDDFFLDDDDSWKTGDPYWEAWEYTIPKGSFLYHATGVATHFKVPKGVTWFVEKKHIADAFAKDDLPGFMEGPNPRVLTYKTLRPIAVVELGGTFFDLPSTPGIDGFGGGFYNQAKEFCKIYDYDGWILPCIYDDTGDQSFDPMPIPDPDDDPGFGMWQLAGAYGDSPAHEQCGADIMLCSPAADMIRFVI